MRLSRWRAIAVVGVVLSGVVVALVLANRRSRSDYASFDRCPVDVSATSLCLATDVGGGEFTIGAKTVPIDRAVILQGGVHVVENREKEIVKDEFIAAQGNATLSATPQIVPGGLAGTVDAGLLPAGPRKAFAGLLASGNTQVTATIELAGPASAIGIDIQHLIEAEGAALTLPIKVKLNNAFLGAGCYIGSGAHPIWLSLTTGRTHPPGPNRPIAGRVGRVGLKDEYNLTTIRGNSLVNNSFAAPAASGCGASGSPLIDSAVDAELGLPAGAGHNTVILDGTLQEANAPAVRAGER